MEKPTPTKDELRSLSYDIENYVSGSNYRLEKIVKNFCFSVTMERIQYDFNWNIDDITEAIVNDIDSSGTMEEFLEFMIEEDGSNRAYSDLKEKYFPTTVEGTYEVSIPAIRNSNISDKPQQSLEPSLAKVEYVKILDAIHRTGSHIEQTIDSFHGLDEEGLRDVILGGLKSAFPEYSATGETFNAHGKVDILLKFTNSNLFAAECKIWNGEDSVNSAIDQLMGYLTWRDSKIALLLFVKRMYFSSILQKIPQIAKAHDCHRRLIDIKDQNRFNFEFSLAKDRNKAIQLTIICFDFYSDMSTFKTKKSNRRNQ